MTYLHSFKIGRPNPTPYRRVFELVPASEAARHKITFSITFAGHMVLWSSYSISNCKYAIDTDKFSLIPRLHATFLA